MGKINVKIVTPERVVYEDFVDQITLPTESGEITVLAGHIPMVSKLRAGEMRTKTGGDETVLAVSTGFIEVKPNSQVVILADTAEREEELEIQKIEEAKARAQKALESARDKDDVAFAHAAAMLEREMARYKVVIKKRRRTS